MSNKDWTDAQVEAEWLFEVAKNKSSMEWFNLVDKYYEKELPLIRTKLLEDISSNT